MRLGRFCFSAWLSAAFALIACLSGADRTLGAETSFTEYQVKALFLFNFTKYVDWPAEAFAETNRARILGIMMTGGAVGTLVAAQVYKVIGAYGWRWVFFVGIAPALLLVFIRRGMVEPEHFAAVRERRRALAGRAQSAEDREFLRFVPVQLFNRQNRYSTMVGLLFCLGTLLAIWTSNIWLPTIQRGILAKEGILDNAAIPFISYGMTMWSIGGIFGYQARMLELLAAKMDARAVSKGPKPIYHPAEGIDISKETEQVRKAIIDGIATLPFLAEIYPSKQRRAVYWIGWADGPYLFVQSGCRICQAAADQNLHEGSRRN